MPNQPSAPIVAPDGPFKAIVPLSAHRTERELADHVLGRLAPAFEIEAEVPGTHCSGKAMRIDAFLRAKTPNEWRNGPATAFGVEL